MALKADRYEESTDISHFYNEGTATRGGVVVLDAAALAGASGAALDQGENLVKYAQVDKDSVPVGILLNDVVNKDLTRTHLNQYKDEVQKGGKVTVLRKGYVVTDKVSGTPTAGQWALASANGTVSGVSDIDLGNVAPNSGENMKVGKFLSVKDSDGYCKVEVNLP